MKVFLLIVMSMWDWIFSAIPILKASCSIDLSSMALVLSEVYFSPEFPP